MQIHLSILLIASFLILSKSEVLFCPAQNFTAAFNEKVGKRSTQPIISLPILRFDQLELALPSYNVYFDTKACTPNDVGQVTVYLGLRMSDTQIGYVHAQVFTPKVDGNIASLTFTPDWTEYVGLLLPKGRLQDTPERAAWNLTLSLNPTKCSGSANLITMSSGCSSIVAEAWQSDKYNVTVQTGQKVSFIHKNTACVVKGEKNDACMGTMIPKFGSLNDTFQGVLIKKPDFYPTLTPVANFTSSAVSEGDVVALVHSQTAQDCPPTGCVVELEFAADPNAEAPATSTSPAPTGSSISSLISSTSPAASKPSLDEPVTTSASVSLESHLGLFSALVIAFSFLLIVPVI